MFWQIIFDQLHVKASDEEYKKARIIVIKTTGYKPKPISELSKQGKEEFEALNCMACHSIHNVGGRIGPMLDGVGAHRSEEYLLAHLINTDKAKEDFAKMTGAQIKYLHHPRISEGAAKPIVSFLLTLPEPPGGFVIQSHSRGLPAEPPKQNVNFKPAPTNDSSQQGEVLYNNLGCAACHSIKHIGGWLGPKLDGVGGRHDRIYIMEHISNPSAEAKEDTSEELPSSQMPSFNLSKKDLQMITDYLMTLEN